MAAVNIVQKKLKKRKGVSGSIDTCDVPNCTRSGQYEVWFLDHYHARWLACKAHSEELKKTLDDIRNTTDEGVVSPLPQVQPPVESQRQAA
jgi:hypothetical protein